MARARKSHDTSEEEVNTSGKRQPPFSPRVGGNKHVIYVTRMKKGNEMKHSVVLSFNALYSAQYFVKFLIGKDTYEPHNGAFGTRYGIITSDGIEINTPIKGEIDKILDHVMTEDEALWVDVSTKSSALRVKYGRIEEAQNDDDHRPRFLNDRSEDERPEDEKPKHKGKKSRDDSPGRTPEPRVPRVRAERPDTSGHVSANDMAKSIGCEGREVRAVLRGLNIPKPAHGWSWPKEEAKSVEGQISKALKEGHKKGKKK